MEITVSFPGDPKKSKKVYAHFDGFTVQTDQPPPSGEGTAPSPFDLFLSSLATCAGIFALGFCQRRNISTDGLAIKQKMDFDPTTHMVSKITLDIELPKSFPPEYKDALVNSVNLCTVKKHMAQPPQFEIHTIG